MEHSKRNFISVDGRYAKNSYDDYFTIGDCIAHDDLNAGTAFIQKFELDYENNEVLVITDKGYAHLDFISKYEK